MSPAGLGVFSKVQLPKGLLIEHLIGKKITGEVGVLLSKPFVFLLRNRVPRETLRCGIDTYETAKNGLCLAAYINFAEPSYYFHGGTANNVTPNCELIVEESFIYVRALKSIPANEELLLAPNEYLPFLNQRTYREQSLKIKMHQTHFPIYEGFEMDKCLRILTFELDPSDVQRAVTFLNIASDLKSEGNHKPILVRHMLEIYPSDIIRYYSLYIAMHQNRRYPWGNDIVVDVWARELMEIDQRMFLADNYRKKTLFIESVHVLFDLIQKKEWHKLNKMYSRQLTPSNLSFLDYDRIIIPNNDNDVHWNLYVIFLDKKTIAYYDSFNIGRPKFKDPKQLLELVQHFAIEEGRSFDEREWKFVAPRCQPQVIYIFF